jgi:hypothetical protein
MERAASILNVPLAQLLPDPPNVGQGITGRGPQLGSLQGIQRVIDLDPEGEGGLCINGQYD